MLYCWKHAPSACSPLRTQPPEQAPTRNRREDHMKIAVCGADARSRSTSRPSSRRLLRPQVTMQAATVAAAVVRAAVVRAAAPAVAWAASVPAAASAVAAEKNSPLFSLSSPPSRTEPWKMNRRTDPDFPSGSVFFSPETWFFVFFVFLNKRTDKTA